MTHNEAFLNAIAEEPDDDGLRLIYADWLQDNGDPERAEFIRVQIATHRNADGNGELTTAEIARLRQREGALLERNKDRWLQPVLSTGARSALHGEFSRGFVDCLFMDAAAFIERGEELFRLTPVPSLSLRKIGRHAKKLSRCEHLGRLRRLTLSGTGPQIRTVLGSPHLTGLRGLWLTGKLGDEDLRGVAALPNLPALDALSLSAERMTGATLPELVARLGPLESLFLEAGRRFEGVRLREVLAALDTRRLRRLEFANVPLRAAGLQAVADAAKLTGLRELWAQGCALDRAAVEALAGAAHLAVETLYLGWDALPAAAATALASWPGLRSVRKLNLDDWHCGPAGAEALAGSPHLGPLADLSLRNCALGDAGVAALAGCPALTGLRILDLERNGITDAGAAALAAAPFSELRRLCVNYNAIGDVGADALAASPHLGALRSLMVGDPVSPTATRRLAVSLPRLNFLIADDVLWAEDIEAVRASA